jgi:hypothetical protein
LENHSKNFPQPSNCPHLDYTALPKDHIRRQANKAFPDGTTNPAINFQLLLGEKTVNEVFK